MLRVCALEHYVAEGNAIIRKCPHVRETGTLHGCDFFLVLHKQRNGLVEFRAQGTVRLQVEMIGMEVGEDVCVHSVEDFRKRDRQFAHRHHYVQLRGIDHLGGERAASEGESLVPADEPGIDEKFHSAEVYA